MNRKADNRVMECSITIRGERISAAGKSKSHRIREEQLLQHSVLLFENPVTIMQMPGRRENRQTVTFCCDSPAV